jgi:hypothetical protein
MVWVGGFQLGGYEWATCGSVEEWRADENRGKIEMNQPSSAALGLLPAMS